MDLLDSYFARIGYRGPRTPSLATLQTLHGLHPAAIPFEAIDVLLGHGIDLDPAAVWTKLVEHRRGGYCFEHNGLFRRVLLALGFTVEPLMARVLWQAAPEAPPPPRTHMALRVSIAGERWLVDVGFGGRVLPAPLRFQDSSPQVTHHDRYRLVPSPEGWRLEVEIEQGWAAAYELSREPVQEADLLAANWFTSTHPNSRFRNVLVASRTTAEARYNLQGNSLTTRPAGGKPTAQVLDRPGLEACLREVFGLPVAPSWQPVLAQACGEGG